MNYLLAIMFLVMGTGCVQAGPDGGPPGHGMPTFWGPGAGILIWFILGVIVGYIIGQLLHTSREKGSYERDLEQRIRELEQEISELKRNLREK